CRLAVESVDGAFPPVAQSVEMRDGSANASLEVSVPDPRPWSPEDPHLYDCVVRLEPVSPHPPAPSPSRGEGEQAYPGGASFPAPPRGRGGRGEGDLSEPDVVRTYFGLRSISTGLWEDKP